MEGRKLKRNKLYALNVRCVSKTTECHVPKNACMSMKISHRNGFFQSLITQIMSLGKENIFFATI